jgi:hypothetical protein
MVRERNDLLGWAIIASVAAAAIAACGGSVAVGQGGGAAGTGGGAGGTCDAGLGGQPPGGCTPCAPPVVVATFPAVEAAEQLVVGFLIDADSVYWVDQTNGVFRAPKSGGSFTLLPGTAGVLGDGLAVDDDGLYLCLPSPDQGVGQLVRTAKDGSDPVTLAADEACFGVAVDGGDVFWATSAGIMRADKTTGAGPTLIADMAATSGAAPSYFAAGASGVWWIETPSGNSEATPLLAVDEQGGPVVALAPMSFGVSMALGGGFAYFSTDWPNATAGTYRAPAPGDAPTRIGDPYPVLAADADFLYTALTIGLVRVPASGAAPEVLVNDASVGEQFLAVDDSCVYWLDDTKQAVMKSWKGAP